MTKFNQHILCLLVLASIHVIKASRTPRSCNGTEPGPIPEQSIGKTFRYLDDCYRPSATETVAVYRNLFVFTPIQPTLRVLGCFEKYAMHYRGPDTPPFISHFKAFAPPSNLTTTEEVETYCKAEEKNHRELYFAYGTTRDLYIDAVRLMIERILRIRDFGCYTDEQGYVLQFPGRAFDNVDVDPVVSYLHNVAFTYGFCAV